LRSCEIRITLRLMVTVNHWN